MVSVRSKKIGNKGYLYAEYSFRLQDGNVKKISKLVKDREEAYSRETKGYFLERMAKAYIEQATAKYKPDPIFTKEIIDRLERIRVEYKYLINNITEPQLKDIIDRFTVNFTYESNAIEGNSLTLKDVALILSENISPAGKDLREVYETRNARIANDLLFKNKIKITIRDIIFLHGILVKDTNVRAGFKKIPNFLAMRDVKTASPEKTVEEMENLVKWYDAEKEKMHPLKIASIFHSRFERIHPFEDGNGRAGRILINAILLENSFPPLIIRKTMRASYLSSLEASDKGYHEKLERFLIEKLVNTFERFFRVYVKYV